MKKLLCIVLISTVSFANCQTSIPGGTVSGTWTLSGSPYLIQGAIMIADGTTLTIDPGVKVEFQGYYKLLVLGRLLAIGNTIDSITFTAANSSVGWFGIRFENTTSNNDTSKFYYCKFLYSNAIGITPNNCGGAFYFYNFSKAVISNSIISNCSASANGGGIYCENSSPVIVKNIISNNSASPNTATIGGGGIYCIHSNSIIIDNTIINNSSGNSGGGIYCSNSSPNISNNTLSYNSVSVFGGGIDFYGDSCYGIFDNNVIAYNTSSFAGGGIYCIYGSLSFSNNFICNNTAPNGGGICCYPNSSPFITNNVICNNTASNNGGGIYFTTNSAPILFNNTISNNSAQFGGALYCTSSSNPSIHNTIMWDNIATSSGNQLYLNDEESDPNIYYCDVQGGQSAFGLNSNVFYLGNYSNDIDTDPLYTAPSGGCGMGYNGTTANWSLQSVSPCINAGDSIGTYPSTDIAGNPRIVGGRIDIGAYEYQGSNGFVNYDIYNRIIIYPNPFSYQTTLQMNKIFKNVTLTLYNTQGRQVKQINNISGQTISLQRDNLSSGLYFLQLIQDNKILTTDKIVITDK